VTCEKTSGERPLEKSLMGWGGTNLTVQQFVRLDGEEKDKRGVRRLVHKVTVKRGGKVEGRGRPSINTQTGGKMA